MTLSRRSLVAGGAVVAGGGLLIPLAARADSARQIEADARAALSRLSASEPKAAALAKRAKAILVFPKIVKAGLVLGGQSGDGALFEGGRATGYYNISAASVGLQIGAQTFSYALMFMTSKALNYLKSSDGWSIGSGPSVVVIDKGAASSVNTTTVTQDVYAFPFGQQGLMAGIGLEGSKITHIRPS